MGIPKFYRWISERYPCLSQVVKDYEVPTFDCLYLDMNGIIHTCSHPNDVDPNFRITEEQIFSLVFNYIELLFRIIKPRKVFYMAIDGCAPRAKMNQQRARRFRSGKEAEEAREKAEKSGKLEKDVDGPAPFDSNCITPGTPFMENLHKHLQYFVHNKITTDPLWQGIRVIFSGHDVPGEGEHKIMDFIRSEKLRPDYDVNTRHCMYGLDADLIMLGLATHEPNFSLLREEVKFGKTSNKRPSSEDVTFHLLSLSLYREYINMEFSDIAAALPFEYDFERLLDDWILMGFFVGNDFMPHLPSFHINEDILPIMYDSYKRVIVKLDGWITDAGVIDMARLQALLDELSKIDEESFGEQTMDFKFLTPAPKGGHGHGHGHGHGAAPQHQGAPAFLMPISMAAKDSDLSGASQGSEEEDDTMQEEFHLHKGTYYREKFHIEENDAPFLTRMAHEYVTGLQWVMLYYIRGVPSWGWFFPFHYAPFVSDVKNIASFVPQFEFGRPFMPFEQLLAVLPASSKELLPEAYQVLMTDPNSPIIDFYPRDFESDLNGKKQDWEAVVLIPFIDEKRLWSAMKLCEKDLKKEEKARNRHSTPILFTYDNSHPNSFSSPSKKFPDIVTCARAQLVSWPHAPFDAPHALRLLPRDVSLHIPGFPTFRHIYHLCQLARVGVTIFNQPSKNESMVVSFPADAAAPDGPGLAAALLGKVVWVRYPNLTQAKVVGVLTAKDSFRRRATGDIVRAKSDAGWEKKVENLQFEYLKKRGIDIGVPSVLVQVTVARGKTAKYTKDGLVQYEMNWSPEEQTFPYNTVVVDLTELKDDSAKATQTIAERFPAGARICYLGKSHYGSVGTVVRVVEKCRVDIEVEECSQPDIQPVLKLQNDDDGWIPESALSRFVNMHGAIVGRLLGSLYVFNGSEADPGAHRTDIGLKMRFKKQGEEALGFSRRSADGSWHVSRLAIEDVQRYLKEFPQVFAAMARNPLAESYFQDDIAGPGKGAEVMDRIRKFVKTLPCRSADRVPCGTNAAPAAAIAKLQEIQASFVCRRKTVAIGKVTPELLYIPEAETLVIGTAPDANAEFRLYDRVINVHEGCSVPWGACGNIVGMLGEDGSVDVVFDTPFLGGTSLGGRCEEGRGFRMVRSWLVDISYGSRMGSSLVHDKVTITKKPTVPSAALGGDTSSPSPVSPSVTPESQKVNVGERGGILEIASQKLWQPDQHLPAGAAAAAAAAASVDEGRNALADLLARASLQPAPSASAPSAAKTAATPTAPSASAIPPPRFGAAVSPLTSAAAAAATSVPVSPLASAPATPSAAPAVPSADALNLLSLLQNASLTSPAAAAASAPVQEALPSTIASLSSLQKAAAAATAVVPTPAPAVPAAQAGNAMRQPNLPTAGAGFAGRKARETMLSGGAPLSAIDLQNLPRIHYEGQEHNLNEYADMWRELLALEGRRPSAGDETALAEQGASPANSPVKGGQQNKGKGPKKQPSAQPKAEPKKKQ